MRQTKCGSKVLFLLAYLINVVRYPSLFHIFIMYDSYLFFTYEKRIFIVLKYYINKI